MKKIFLITLLLLTCACGQKSEPLDQSTEKAKNMLSSKGTLSLRGEKSSMINIVYKLDEDTTIYSNNSLPLYTDEDGKKVNLKAILNDKLLTMDEIISNFEQYEVANDGGSIVYKSKDGKVYLAKCNSNEGNGNIKDIFITDSEDVLKYCTK